MSRSSSLWPIATRSKKRSRIHEHLYREFSVKEISRCSKGTKTASRSPFRKDPKEILTPIERFGIVACMSKNRVIGVNGKLPWNLVDDRRIFESLTKDKLLIIGRKTFEEESDQSHISHAAMCIVISKSLRFGDDTKSPKLLRSGTAMYVVPSFPEALHLAGKLCANVEENHGTNNNLPVADDPVAIQCWVAGGESVFNAAVLHPSAKYICLTVVDMEIDTNMLTATEVARFPPKYHWDVKYKQIAATELSSNADESIRATHYVMQHLKGAR